MRNNNIPCEEDSIQVNVAEEKQKSGILINELDNFYQYCIKELSLNIIGLMCLPPFDSDSQKYFNHNWQYTCSEIK